MLRSTHLFGSTAAMALLAGVLCAPPLSAQGVAEQAPAGASPTPAEERTTSATGGDPGGPTDIVVTAQRRTQRLQDVPVAVSVVSGAALAQANIKNLTDLSVRVPNLKIAPGALVDFLNIRGVGSGNNAGFEQSVGTFVDGVYRARSRAVRAALFDVDQVEVLKGPQSTFFGANTVAGALNITTRKPTDAFSYNAQALGGTDGEYGFEGGITTPVADGLALRVAGRADGIRGWVRVGDSGHGPNSDSQQGRVALRYLASPSFRSDLRLDIGHTSTKNAYPFELIGCPPPAPFVLTPANSCSLFRALRGGAAVDDRLDQHSDQTPTFARYRFYEAAWTNGLDVGGGTLTSLTSYFRHRSEDRVNQVPFPIVSPSQPGADGQPLQSTEKYHQFAQELRFQSRTGGTIEYTLGGYFSQSKLTYLRIAGFYFSNFGAIPAVAATGSAASTGLAATTDVFQDDRVLSGFAAVTVRPLAGLRVNLGGRYTNDHKDTHRVQSFGTARNADRGTYVQLPAATQAVLSRLIRSDLTDFPDPKRTDDKFMPSAGIQYDVARNLMTYVTYSRGFKAGGYNANSLAVSFGPESVDDYEIGLKGTFLDRRLTLNADLFRADYKDLQETTLVFTAGVPVSLVANAAKSRSQGAEVGGSFRASRALTLNAELAYLDAKYRDYANGACTILAGTQGCTSQDLSGKRRPFAPRFSGNVGATLTVPAGRNEISLNPTLYFTSAYFQSATADPLLRQKGYAKVDARIAYGPSDRRWSLAIIGKNLSDRLTASFRQPVTNATGSIEALTERGRSVAVQFSISG